MTKTALQLCFFISLIATVSSCLVVREFVAEQTVIQATPAMATVSPTETSAPVISLPTLTVVGSLVTPTHTATPVVVEPPPIPTIVPDLVPTPLDPAYTVRVPILMYHYLSDPPADANSIRLDLSVTPANFEAQLAYLREAGFETISMHDLFVSLTQQTPLPDKPIILSFDDGYRDAYEQAFPILQKYDYTATFFIFTQVIDTYNEDYLTWEMVQEMHAAGMEFGSHSYTHPDLRERDIDFLVYQILGPKQAIEERIGEPVRFFCYPGGRYDQLVIDVLDSANFWGATTTQWGDTHSFNNRFELPRLRIRGSDTVAMLAARLPH